MQEAASASLKRVVDRGAHWMGVLEACLTFIHGMHPLSVPSAFGDTAYFFDEALVCSTTKPL